ncbi:MAG: hypothetical protein QOI60_503, partial [Actinomycetota bacterium]|nr:hypothetical protein [Actinomycetota bacterium]
MRLLGIDSGTMTRDYLSVDDLSPQELTQ